MFKINRKSNFSKCFLVFFLVFFAAYKSVVFLHSFSHLSKEISISQGNEGGLLKQMIFGHSKNHHKNNYDCILYSAFNLQNNLLLSIFDFAILSYFMIFFTRFFSRVKLSYLLSSYYSQAPPAIS